MSLISCKWQKISKTIIWAAISSAQLNSRSQLISSSWSEALYLVLISSLSAGRAQGLDQELLHAHSAHTPYVWHPCFRPLVMSIWFHWFFHTSPIHPDLSPVTSLLLLPISFWCWCFCSKLLYGYFVEHQTMSSTPLEESRKLPFPESSHWGIELSLVNKTGDGSGSARVRWEPF